MRNLWSVLKMALRAAMWKSTSDPQIQSLSAVVLWLAAAVAASLAFDYAVAEFPAQFSPQGLTSVAGLLALSSLVAAFFVRPDNRATFLCAGLATTVIIYAVSVTAAMVGPLLDPSILGWWQRASLPFLVAYVGWFLGVQYALFNSVEPRSPGRQLVRSVGLVAASLATFALFPNYPVFVGKQFDASTANVWEYARSALLAPDSDSNAPDQIDRARVELAQPALMDQAIARLAAQVKGTTDIFALGVAGWSEEDVFIKELDGAFDSIVRTLPIKGHALRLVNHADSVADIPTATRQNFAAAIRAIGRVMDKEEDVLLLFMTSHGFESGVALYLPGIVSAWLSPEDVAAVLDREGIKNRIIIVSACYSGVFVGPLASDDSIILTAADENNVSFGCSNEREWTYFGDAFFNHGVKLGADLQTAFAIAKDTIAQWENRDRLPPSNPTAHFGQALVDKLAPVYIRNKAAALGPTDGGTAQISK
jgi:hypothetical protein